MFLKEFLMAFIPYEFIQNILQKYFHFILYIELILILLFLYKTKIISEVIQSLNKHKFFLILLIVLTLFLSLSNKPFNTLVYYNEQNYLISAQNIVEIGSNSLCNSRENNICTYTSIMPHGIGLSSIYSLAYNYDYKTFYTKLAILNIITHLLSSILIFVISSKLFKNNLTKYLSSFIYAILPYNLIYSTAIMPEIITSFFIIIMIFSLINYLNSDNDKFKINNIILNIISINIFSSLRAEYYILVIIPLFLLIKTILKNISNYNKQKNNNQNKDNIDNNYRYNQHSNYFSNFDKNELIQNIFLGLVIIISFSSATTIFISYFINKLFIVIGRKININFLDSSYFEYFLKRLV